MSRQSGDELAAGGTIFNGFDYHIQVWVRGGVVLDCGHDPARRSCCAAREYRGRDIRTIDGHEVRPC